MLELPFICGTKITIDDGGLVIAPQIPQIP